MAAVIQGLFFDPPIAIARLGGSDNPQEAYAWKETASPRTIGETVIVPDWTLDVLPDGSLAPRLPASVALRDGPLVRPVCVFLEVWAMIGAAGSATSTWRAVPLTESVLRDGGATLADLSFTVDARNRKAARRAGNDALQFGTFPPVVLRGDDHREARLLAGSPPDAARPMIPRDRNVPMGRVQVIRPGTQPAAGAAPWTDRVNVETIRLRFVPAKGEFYGPPDAARPLSTGGRARIAPVRLENAFLDARAGWFGNDAQNGAPDQPSDTYDGADVSTRANGPNPSYGVVDDTCDARISVTLGSRGRGRTPLVAHANVFVGPPDFAPDRRPFLSLADEINDRGSRNAARSAALSEQDRDAWVQDLFERAFETVSLFNVDHWRDIRGARLSGARLRARPVPGDATPQPRVAMGGLDALRAPDTAVAAPGPEPLPMSRHAQERHREIAAIENLRDLVREQPQRLRQLVRAVFEVESGVDSSASTTMRMPPFMRHSNALPLTLSAWQYDLLMAWADAAARRSPASAPVPAPLTARSETRRAEVLARVRRGRGR